MHFTTTPSLFFFLVATTLSMPTPQGFSSELASRGFITCDLTICNPVQPEDFPEPPSIIGLPVKGCDPRNCDPVKKLGLSKRTEGTEAIVARAAGSAFVGDGFVNSGSGVNNGKRSLNTVDARTESASTEIGDGIVIGSKEKVRRVPIGDSNGAPSLHRRHWGVGNGAPAIYDGADGGSGGVYPAVSDASAVEGQHSGVGSGGVGVEKREAEATYSVG